MYVRRPQIHAHSCVITAAFRAWWSVGAGMEIQALGRKFRCYDLIVDEGAVYEVDGGLPPNGWHLRLALEAAIQ